jgi:hypothetical protein
MPKPDVDQAYVHSLALLHAPSNLFPKNKVTDNLIKQTNNINIKKEITFIKQTIAHDAITGTEFDSP